MRAGLLGGLAAACLLGAAPAAMAGQHQIDLSPYVNQGFYSNGWFLNAGFGSIIGSTTGNQGSSIRFNVANVSDPLKGDLNFWYGLDNGSGTNLFDGVPNEITIPITVSGVRTVYTLAANTFGIDGANEFSVTFHGAGGDLTAYYVGGQNTRDYNNLNCATTGCTDTPGADTWFANGWGQSLELVTWTLPTDFGLTSMTFRQSPDTLNGAILAGVTVGVPEPATWGLLIAGFGLTGATLRRRRMATVRV